jgi:hypothetical protein
MTLQLLEYLPGTTMPYLEKGIEGAVSCASRSIPLQMFQVKRAIQ